MSSPPTPEDPPKSDEGGRRKRRLPRPLDATRLEELALSYVGRFATTRLKLLRYLQRKLRERDWEGEAPPDVDRIVARFAELGYIDDAAYGAMKARDLAARGYGPRRVGQALYQAGVAGADGEEAARIADHARVDAALRYARRRRVGPYGIDASDDPRQREKTIAAFLRAGHGFELAKAILAMPPGTDEADPAFDDLRGRFMSD